jgi:hypothetical protein
MNTTQWRGSRKLMQGRWSHLVIGVSGPTWRLLQKLVLQLVKGPLVDKGRIGLRDTSKAEVARRQVQRRKVEMRPKKQRKQCVASSSAQTVVNWDIEKIALSDGSMEQRKGKCSNINSLCHFILLIINLIPFFMCRKRKPRKNTTKGWFPKEASTSKPKPLDTSPPTQDVDASSPPFEDVGASSPPRIQKHAVLKKLTPKKKIR